MVKFLGAWVRLLLPTFFRWNLFALAVLLDAMKSKNKHRTSQTLSYKKLQHIVALVATLS